MESDIDQVQSGAKPKIISLPKPKSQQALSMGRQDGLKVIEYFCTEYQGISADSQKKMKSWMRDKTLVVSKTCVNMTFAMFLHEKNNTTDGCFDKWNIEDFANASKSVLKQRSLSSKKQSVTVDEISSELLRLTEYLASGPQSSKNEKVHYLPAEENVSSLGSVTSTTHKDYSKDDDGSGKTGETSGQDERAIQQEENGIEKLISTAPQKESATLQEEESDKSGVMTDQDLVNEQATEQEKDEVKSRESVEPVTRSSPIRRRSRSLDSSVLSLDCSPCQQLPCANQSLRKSSSAEDIRYFRIPCDHGPRRGGLVADEFMCHWCATHYNK